MTSKKDTYEEKDRYWDLDRKFCHKMMGDFGARQLEERAVELLPSPEHDINMEDCIEQFDRLKKTALYQFVQDSQRVNIDNARTLIFKLTSGEHPKGDLLSEGGFLQKVYNSIQFFAREEEKIGQRAGVPRQ